jgi:beta-lactamase class A
VLPALLCLCALVVLVPLGWRWWTGRSTPDARDGGAAVVGPAGAPASADAPAVAPLPAGSLLETTTPALPTPHPDPALQSLVARAVDPENGTAAVVVRQLTTGASATYQDRDVFPSASLAKVPILVEAYRQLAAGTLRRDESILITADNISDGSGVLQARAGDRLTVAELLRLAVSVSDNTAARLLLRRVGGEAAVNRTMGALGLAQTRLYADDRPNTTTAGEMASLMTWIVTRAPPRDAPPPPLPGLRSQIPGFGAPAAPTGAPAPESLASLLALSQAQAWLTDELPKGVSVAHKSGQLPGVRHDAGVVYGPGGPYVVVVLTGDLADQGDAETFIAGLAKGVYDYFGKP